MSQRTLVVVLIAAVAIVAIALWFKQTMQPQQPQATAPEASGQMPGMPPEGMAAAPALEPGIAWQVPARWQEQAERPMRVATYTVPKASGDPEDGECAVFYFGPNQGGGVEDNIDRWIGQFEDPGTPARSKQTVNGLEVSRVSVDGTFLAPSGMTMEPTAQKKDYRLLGAIVSGPNGFVFFKFTGPKKTVEQATKEFDGMLASMQAS